MSPELWTDLKKQIYLGSDHFIDTMVKTVIKDKRDLDDVPRLQHRALPKPIADYRDQCTNRNDAIRAAFNSGGYTMKAIGEYFNLHYTSVSRIVKQGD